MLVIGGALRRCEAGDAIFSATPQAVSCRCTASRRCQTLNVAVFKFGHACARRRGRKNWMNPSILVAAERTGASARVA